MAEPTEQDETLALMYMESHPHLAGIVARAIANEREHIRQMVTQHAAEWWPHSQSAKELETLLAAIDGQQKGLDHE